MGDYIAFLDADDCWYPKKHQLVLLIINLVIIFLSGTRGYMIMALLPLIPLIYCYTIKQNRSKLRSVVFISLYFIAASLAEKFMGRDINDYKFMMINGNIAFVWVDADRYAGHKRGVYDSTWNMLPFQLHTYPIYKTEPPKSFEKMKELASVLASGFDTVRVDFYDIDGAVYFGELTFTTSSGSELFYPEKWDENAIEGTNAQ